jgi:dihydroflavonol-4-reductase
LEQILGKLAAITGQPAPALRLPYAVAYAAGVVTTAWARVSGKPPRVPLDAVRMARKKMFVSHAKAARDLGYDPGPPRQALARAVEWFRANGYC